MHKYIKAIGFQNIKSEQEWKDILLDTEKDFTEYERTAIEETLDFCELRKEYGVGIGLYSCGLIDENEEFEREFYYPYFEGQGITSYADVIVEQRPDRRAYLGICEDSKVGVNIIFHLINGMEYLKEQQLGHLPKRSTSVTLSALATSGRILLPVMKSPEQKKERMEASRSRMMLISEAKKGNSDAIESLTLDDIDTYTEVTQRIRREDIYSIVDTCFMPYGLECDQYSIIGEILDIDTVENKVTKEIIYVFMLEVNELTFDVCVPQNTVVGEPAVGRRFKANIWLQGKINF